MRKQSACLLDLPFCRQTDFGNVPTLQGKRCFANSAKCQNGWRLNSFLWLVMFFRLSLDRNTHGFGADSISPGSSPEGGGRGGGGVTSYGTCHLFSSTAFPWKKMRWAEVTEEKQKPQRPPQGLAMTHRPQGKGLGLGGRPTGSGPRPVV